MPACAFTAIASGEVILAEAPINPGWVLAGQPRARMGEVARSADGTCVTVVWECTAGTFEWHFGVDETVHIIEGEVTVADARGNERTLRPGDIGFFPVGGKTIWKVETHVRKMAVCRHAMPAPLGFALRAFNKLKSLAGMGAGSGAMGAQALRKTG